MERNVAKKVLSCLAVICSLHVMLPMEAYPWNQATHAYIAYRLGAQLGYDNLNEIWGSVTPDMTNFVFDSSLCPGWVADQMQGTNPETSLKLWGVADTNAETTLGFGFVSHNDGWGADHAAHHACLTCGENTGYIILKAQLLLKTSTDAATPQQTFGEQLAGLGMNPDQQSMVAHLITEDAVDIRLAHDVEPMIGRKLATAARGVSREFPPLLTKAYAADYASYCFGGDYSKAVTELTSMEKNHRKDMVFLGQAISQPEPVAVQLVAEQIVAVLPGFLGFPFPVPESEVVEIIKKGITTSMQLCAGDYLQEVNATVDYVGRNMAEHAVSYVPKGPKERN